MPPTKIGDELLTSSQAAGVNVCFCIMIERQEGRKEGGLAALYT